MKIEQETVEVRIDATERVEYSHTVSMPKAEFDRLSAALNSNDRAERRRAEGEIEGCWLNPLEVSDADDFELKTFDLVDA